MDFSSWLLVAYLFTVLGVMATVLSENRNPLKASAWIMIVGLVPVFGLILYVVFGQDQRRLHRINQRFNRRVMRRPQVLTLPKHLQKKRQPNEENQHLIELLERNSGSSLLQLQSLEIYAWGQEMYEALFQDLEKAEEYIHLQAYIFAADEVLEHLSDILVRKAQEGVAVRVIYDHLGSYSVPESYWRRLREAGVQVYAFMRVVFPLLSTTVNYRNHRKIVVIDGKIGYVGGMNFAQRYLSGNELGRWRDTHFRLTGVAVAGLQSSFLIDWYAVSRRVVNIDRYLAPTTPPNEYSPSIQFVPGGPISPWRTIEQAIIYMISRADRSICIQTPYFLPTENLNNALVTAALAGVDVQLMLPRRTDSRLTTYAARSYLGQLLEAGVRVFFYQRGFLHSKLLLVDDQISAIGSANMDFRSLEHNFEITGFVYDEGISRRLHLLFDEDKERCEELTRQEWEGRGWLSRFAESVMRLFAPLL